MEMPTQIKYKNFKHKTHTLYYCPDCKVYVYPQGLRTHEVSCPFCGFYFGCDD